MFVDEKSMRGNGKMKVVIKFKNGGWESCTDVKTIEYRPEHSSSIIYSIAAREGTYRRYVSVDEVKSFTCDGEIVYHE